MGFFLGDERMDFLTYNKNIHPVLWGFVYLFKETLIYYFFNHCGNKQISEHNDNDAGMVDQPVKWA